MKTNTVYILELEESKYYVGKTTNLERRIDEHFSGIKSSEWTKKYKPINVLKVIHDCDRFDEDKFTLKYMSIYGILNVRGGPFVQISLSPETISHIEKRIRMALDLCANCGSSEHFIGNCKSNKKIKTSESKESCTVCKSRTHFTEDCEFYLP